MRRSRMWIWAALTMAVVGCRKVEQANPVGIWDITANDALGKLFNGKHEASFSVEFKPDKTYTVTIVVERLGPEGKPKASNSHGTYVIKGNDLYLTSTSTDYPSFKATLSADGQTLSTLNPDSSVTTFKRRPDSPNPE